MVILNFSLLKKHQKWDFKKNSYKISVLKWKNKNYFKKWDDWKFETCGTPSSNIQLTLSSFFPGKYQVNPRVPPLDKRILLVDSSAHFMFAYFSFHFWIQTSKINRRLWGLYAKYASKQQNIRQLHHTHALHRWTIVWFETFEYTIHKLVHCTYYTWIICDYLYYYKDTDW